ncbi:MAG: exosortase A [Halioglobus sp.]|jgi:exosortase A
MADLMEIEHGALNSMDRNIRGGGRAVWLAAGFLCMLLVVFHETAWSMVSTWMRSETFTHGFLILPIVLWMVWERRSQLKAATAMPEYRALILLASSGFVWFLAYLVDVLVIQQYALVAMAVFGLWGILGNQVCWLIAFPLTYLLFLVPAGEGLVPVMMEFTATFTVAMVKLSGIPVYREGMFFYLPSGNWSVVEACSGVRYLIASVTLGSLYAYLTYRSVQKRLVFILISFVVPVIANGLRAYMIVMLGHLSDMTIATGVDHLIYGWIFFGVVMLILFSLGGIWRDHPIESTSGENVSNVIISDGIGRESLEKISSQASLFPSLCLASLLSLVGVIIWPLLAFAVEDRQVSTLAEPLYLPEEIAGWEPSGFYPSGTGRPKTQDLGAQGLVAGSPVAHKAAKSGPAYWQPAAGAAPRIASRSYENQGRVVSLTLHQFLQQQSQGDELVSSKDLLSSDGASHWRVTARGKSQVILPGGVIPIRQAHLSDGRGEELLVWSWYRVGHRYSANDYQTKIFEVLTALTFGRTDSARIFLATTLADGDIGESDAAQILKEFLEVALPDMVLTLDQSAGVE